MLRQVWLWLDIGVGVCVEVGSGVVVGPLPVVVEGRVVEAAASADAST